MNIFTQGQANNPSFYRLTVGAYYCHMCLISSLFFPSFLTSRGGLFVLYKYLFRSSVRSSFFYSSFPYTPSPALSFCRCDLSVEQFYIERLTVITSLPIEVHQTQDTQWNNRQRIWINVKISHTVHVGLNPDSINMFPHIPLKKNNTFWSAISKLTNCNCSLTPLVTDEFYSIQFYSILGCVLPLQEVASPPPPPPPQTASLA